MDVTAGTDSSRSLETRSKAELSSNGSETLLAEITANRILSNPNLSRVTGRGFTEILPCLVEIDPAAPIKLHLMHPLQKGAGSQKTKIDWVASR